jgi:hypothetical protein
LLYLGRLLMMQILEATRKAFSLEATKIHRSKGHSVIICI